MTFDSPGAMTRPSVGESLAADASQRIDGALRVSISGAVVVPNVELGEVAV